MITIDILPQAGLTSQREDTIRAVLERAAEQALAYMRAEGDLSLVLSDDRALQELNLRFLGVDAPTDVLSFPDNEPDPETEAAYLGDIIISCPRAEAQAQAGGHSLEDELRLLSVHGVLHLLGHDHAGDEQRESMWALQAAILERLGAQIRGPGYEV